MNEQLQNEGTVKFDQQLLPIYPSTQVTVWGTSESAYCGGVAHQFKLQNSLGFNDGQAQYDDSFQTIQFVQKNEDGTMIPGAQSEQLLRMLIERHKSMHAKFPSVEGAAMIESLEKALYWSEQRVIARMERGVMGQLTK